jgi:hypothetical protein
VHQKGGSLSVFLAGGKEKKKERKRKEKGRKEKKKGEKEKKKGEKKRKRERRDLRTRLA